MQPLDTQSVKEWRHRRMLSQQEVADRAGTSLFTIQRIERGEGNVRPKTGRAVAAALGVPIEELLPKAQAPLFRELPDSSAAEEQRRAEWEAAVRSAHQLREHGRTRLQELLSSWRASKERGEPYDARRNYLDEMRNLLQRAYDAETALISALADPLDLDEFAELQAADRFYVELWRLVQDAGLSVYTGNAQEGELAQAGQPEVHNVEEPRAA